MSAHLCEDSRDVRTFVRGFWRCPHINFVLGFWRCPHICARILEMSAHLCEDSGIEEIMIIDRNVREITDATQS